SPRGEPTCVAARLGLLRAGRPPAAPHLQAALAATADIARAARPFAAAGSILAAFEEPALAPIGWPAGPPGAACGGAARRGGGGRRRGRRATAGTTSSTAAPAGPAAARPITWWWWARASRFGGATPR